jgi:hypothetical protein
MVGRAETDDSACLYDSTSGLVFGPIFHGGEEEAEMFLDYLEKEHGVIDARGVNLGDLMSHWAQFCKKYTNAQGDRTYPHAN